MSDYTSISIKDAMSNIASNNYLLPAIQRKFVWESEQIEMLFDSILQNYPINSFMFWKVTDDNVKNDYKFYQFLKDYCAKFHEDNIDAAPGLLENNFYAIIDGQQRMTSLYVGLVGTYRKKKPNKRWKDTEDAMPTKRLYLELSSPIVSQIDNEKKYNFLFLSSEEKKEDLKKNPTHFWFRVGDVVGWNNLSEVNKYLKSNKLQDNDYASNTLSDLFNKIKTEKLINYYEITEQDQDKVLDVFLRTNSGGTPLSFSDLLMSISSANWTTYVARDEMKSIKEEIYTFGNPKFDVSQDFILKTILVLSGADIRFKIKNFGRSNISLFESNWKKIRKSLVSTFALLEQLGYNDVILRAKNAAIPIAYYIYKNNLSDSIIKPTKHKQDKDKISKWLAMSLLKGIFGGQSDGVLNSIREVIDSSKGTNFPMQEIFDKFKGNNKNYDFNKDLIDSLLEEEYGSSNAGALLFLLYPDVVSKYGKAVDEDHMHPKIMFEDKTKFGSLGLSKADKDYYKKKYNTILNLQLLGESENKSKGDDPLSKWAKENKIKYKDLFVEKATSLDIKNFKKFTQDRKKKISAELKKILAI